MLACSMIEARRTVSPPNSPPIYGRFMQVDPVGYDDQFNLYAYVGNDPVNGTDPDGAESSFEYATQRDDRAYLSGDIDEDEYRDRQQARGAGGVIGGLIVGTAVATRGFGIPAATRWLSTQITNSAFRAAASQYPKQLAQNLRMTSGQIQGSIKSLGRQIDMHKGWLKNPSSKIKNWNQFSSERKRNTLHHWRQDVKRQEAYRKIAEGVLRERRICTGSRICK